MRSLSSRFPLSLPLFLAFLVHLPRHGAAQKTATCYWEYLDQVASASNDGPCGTWDGSTVLECCSSGDTCLGDNICYGLGGSHKGGSGYYLSGCTDITLSSPTCTPHCGSNGYPDIVYNATTQEWACCTVDDFNVNCDLPTTESWSAPAPTQLTGTFVAHSATNLPQSLLPGQSAAASTTTSSSTSASSSTKMPAAAATATATTTPTASVIAADSDPLSIGAKAGIAIGVVLAFILAIGGVIAGLIQKRKRAREFANGIALKNKRNDKAKFHYYGYGGGTGYYQVPVVDGPYHELSPDPNPIELSGTIRPVELGNWENYEGRSYRVPEPVKKHDTYYHP